MFYHYEGFDEEESTLSRYKRENFVLSFKKQKIIKKIPNQMHVILSG